MILLSFDTEEFDLPCEYGVKHRPVEDGMEVSRYGLVRILDLLKAEDVRATFFCTTTFAQHAPDLMERIVNEGHEVASHGCNHLEPRPEDVITSKRLLEEQTGVTVKGYRQPRMFPVSIEELKRQGYLYNSSLNPAFIPGRYMHLDQPRTPFMQDGVFQIPASVTPWFRFPLFWLSLHNLPLWLYKRWARWTWRHDGQFVHYNHPWEFYPLKEHPEWHIPFIIKRNSGDELLRRLGEVIRMFKKEHALFATYSEYVASRYNFSSTSTITTIRTAN